MELYNPFRFLCGGARRLLANCNIMALFTGEGDKGKTSIFGCNQKVSKSSAVTEALGALDEINSFFGLCKVKSEGEIQNLIRQMQEDLFIIQAELGGTDKTIKENKIEEMEKKIEEMEKEMPPIKSFFISGGTELSALLDVARTMARRAERRVVAAAEEGRIKVGVHTLAYMNRLSSILFALARYANYLADVKEEAPSYR